MKGAAKLYYFMIKLIKYSQLKLKKVMN